MTDNIRTNFCATCKEQADRIEAQAAEIERLKDRLGWICAVMDLDDEVTLQWIYTELQALRGVE
jgi:hypothetical protein